MASLDDILYSSKTLVLDDLLHFALSLYAWLSGDKRAGLEASHSRDSWGWSRFGDANLGVFGRRSA
jgi:hypothetical protein